MAYPDEEIRRLKWWLNEIYEIARTSDGVEFYAMMAWKALCGAPIPTKDGDAKGE